MNEEKNPVAAPEEFITEERLKKAAAYIEEEAGPSRRLTGKMGVFITAVAILMSLVHLYAAIGLIMTQTLRGVHVGKHRKYSLDLRHGLSRDLRPLRRHGWVDVQAGQLF